ncbi:MAG: YggU family protein [Magnetococcales bacterium]|nr:YggU family protein [Magnetococcales bacterium]MBF0157654.1 YggU family protein [Magnetococcales bacterium]
MVGNVTTGGRGAEALRWEGGCLFLAIHVQPRASREAVVGMHGGSLKVALRAPAVEGAANKALIHFLASALGISPSRVRIVRGEKSREKRLAIEGVGGEALRAFCDRWKLPFPSPPEGVTALR